MNPAYNDPFRPAGKPVEASGMPQFNIHTVLIAARCWWHIALPLGLLLASAAAVILYYTSTPTYTAQTWLMIKARAPVVVRELPMDDPQKFVQNQIELLKSPLVLGPVTSDSAIAGTPELINELDRQKYLRDHLKVSNRGNSDFFTIEFTSQSPEKAALIVNRVAEEYRLLQERHEKKLKSMTVEKLREQHHNKEVELRRLKDTLDLLVKQDPSLALSTQRRTEPGEGFSMKNHIESQIGALEIDQLELSAKITAAKQLETRLSFDPSDSQVEALVHSHATAQKLKLFLEEDKKKLEEHKRLSVDWTKSSPAKQLEQRIQENEAAIEKQLAELRTWTKEDLRKGSLGQWQDQIRRMEQQFEENEGIRSHLSEKLKTLSGVQEQKASKAQDYEFARIEYERTSNTLAAIGDRIEHMNMEQGAPARVDLLHEAAIPSRPDEAVPYKKMSMAAMAALLVPFGLAVGIEVLFRRVSSRQQLEAAGQIAVVGEVTNLPARVNSRRAASDPASRDRQLFEESIDGLRTYLSLVDSMKGRKILAVTSAISREGKTSLASQLAVSMASATGRPTLLIDGDMRSPDVHRIFDVDRGPGLCDVLLGKCTVEEAIETGFSDTLHLLTAGELQVSPHRVLSNHTFAELMSKLSGMYEQIVIDTPPILAASEALLMASAADAAVLCVRRDFSRMDQVAEAFARLRSAGVKTAGAVLNGIPARHYAYRYGSYYYNRQRPGAAEATSPGAETA